MKNKNTYKTGTEVELCYCAELTGKVGTITTTFHDNYTHGHAEWVQVKLDNGTTKVLRTCFVREINTK
jgi:hypothetical protein